MINKIYSINLSSNRERRDFQRRMSQFINFPINIYNAVNGKKFSFFDKLKLIYPDKILGFDLFSTCPFIFFFSGTLACSLSHYNLINLIKNDSNNTLITEDDNEYLCSDFILRVNNMIKTLPNDWDVVFFDHKNVFDKSSRCVSYNDFFYKLLNKRQEDSLSNVTLDGNCYLVNSRFCNKYLKYKITDHADYILTRMKLNVYITKEIMVCQNDDLNNKSDREKNDFIHTNVKKYYKKEIYGILFFIFSLISYFWFF